jgi:branched-chain amino acid transport system permease protein
MDSLFFANVSIFGVEASIGVGRVHLGAIPTQSPKAYFILLAVVFSMIGVGLVLVRRSRFGRRLVAMGDSPEACETLGISVTRTKLLVFSVSAGIAGLGGALYGGQQTEVGPGDFATLVSLTVVLLAILWGAKSVPAMLLAGITFVIGPVVQEHVPALRDVLYLSVGLVAVSVGQNPNGAFGNKTLLSWLFARRNSSADPEESVEKDLLQSPKGEQPVLGGG